MTHNKTRISNDMRRAQAETVSEERLKHMANSPAHIIQGSAPVSLKSGELRGMAEEILASRQALLAHPLHNPSPSDGEVSDVLRRARNYIDDMPHLFPENAHPNDRDTHRQLEAEREPLLLALTAAIQSKRGQP